MQSQRQREENEERLLAEFGAMYEELYAWHEAHPEASFDEIANQVTPRRQALMGELLAQLARQHGDGVAVEGLVCEECGSQLEYRSLAFSHPRLPTRLKSWTDPSGEIIDNQRLL